MAVSSIITAKSHARCRSAHPRCRNRMILRQSAWWFGEAGGAMAGLISGETVDWRVGSINTVDGMPDAT